MFPSTIIKLLLLSVVLMSVFSYAMDIQMNNNVYKSEDKGTDLWDTYKKSFIISALLRSIAIILMLFTLYYT